MTFVPRDWKVNRVCLVNWGGFCGLNSIFIQPAGSSHSNFTLGNLRVTDTFVEKVHYWSNKMKLSRGIGAYGSRKISRNIWRWSWKGWSSLNIVFLLWLAPTRLADVRHSKPVYMGAHCLVGGHRLRCWHRADSGTHALLFRGIMFQSPPGLLLVWKEG